MPTVKSVSTWNGGFSSGTSHGPITLPDSISPGDLLVCIFSCDGSIQTAGFTIPVGWNLAKSARYGTTVTGAVFWKVATDDNALTIGTSAFEIASAVMYCIEDAWMISVDSSTGSSTNSSHAEGGHRETLTDPPKEAIYIAARAGDSTVVATAPPSGFSDMQTVAAVSTAGASLNTAVYVGTEVTLTPSAWVSAFEQWVTFTIAVYQSVRISGHVYGADGQPIVCEYQVLERDTGLLYMPKYINEIHAKTYSSFEGSFLFGLKEDAEVNIIFLDPTGTKQDLLISRVVPI